MSEAEQLRNMVLAFRVSELTMLLNFAGKNKAGRKQDLQQRALDLIKLKNTAINVKIRELYKTVQQSQGMATPAVDPTSIPMPSAPPPAQSYPQSYQQQSATRSVSNSLQAAQKAVSEATLRGQNPYTTTQPYGSGYSSKSSVGFPVHPDVKLKKLPFYENIAEILKPSSLIPAPGARFHEAQFQFHLTPQQATDVAMNRDLRPGKNEYVIQIQLRFALLETTSEQEDCFPPNINVKVNGKPAPLPNPIPTNKPGVEPKRPPRPVNISPLCKLSPVVPNHIHVSWSAEIGRNYVLAVYLVHKLTSQDLLGRLQKKGARPLEYTKGLIKDKLQEDMDSEIALTSLHVSVNCPLGKMRMSIPCRANSCQHLQCFDGSLFLQMNERKPTWVCPVCDKALLCDDLAIDGYFSDVLRSVALPNECSEIEMKLDGSWTPKFVKENNKVSTSVITSKPKGSEEVLDIDDGDDSGSSRSISPSGTGKKRPAEPEIVCLDSDDEDGGPPPAKKTAESARTASTLTDMLNTPTLDPETGVFIPPVPAQAPPQRPPSPDIIELD